MTFEAKKEGRQDTMVTNPLTFVNNPMEFNRRLLEGRTRQYEQAAHRGEGVVFFDRGIPDVLAYMDYFGQEYGAAFTKASREFRYDAVIVIPPWQSIYISDNERLESFEEATEIHGYLEATYLGLGYQPLYIPQGSVEKRTLVIKEFVNRLL
jgi:predicted ATPase